MRVLVTRPLEGARETAAKLTALGHEASIAPLLEIRFRPGPEISAAGVQAILATSSNGVRALARRTKARDIPLFAVGYQTAAVARASGFQHVKDAGGDGRSLASATIAWATPEAGDLLHGAGAETPGAIAKDLAAHGFTVRTVFLYEAVAARAFPATARDRLQNGMLDAVLHFSPRSARSFVDCVEAAALERPCRKLISCCISRATAAALSPISFKAVCLAAHPDQESLLALLD